MPHLVIERLREDPDWWSWFSCGDGTYAADTPSKLVKRRSASVAYVVEAVDIIAGLMFVFGSVCFLPQYSIDLGIFEDGCILFVVGSALYLLICLYCLSEAIEHEGWWSLESCENSLYVSGSLTFLLGTVMYWPKGISDPEVAKMYLHGVKAGSMSVAVRVNELNTQFNGTMLFIAGSVMFALAAFVNGLNLRQCGDVRSQMLTAITSLYMVGSLLFVMGSVAFIPDFGCNENMEWLGAWCFITGSAMFELGGLISLSRTMREFNSPENASLHDEKEVLRVKAASGSSAFNGI
eukprot:TRINITY_DN72832_c0_g1_i1.p1 TRINITY_DN72832_c0_g1~~TRINITY_DN72832_c0_g1_i1.p1  ORF type:complete len:293 (-),score=49.72 TRINITY_DN72832_c0_g1_i1:62-940(-)